MRVTISNYLADIERSFQSIDPQPIEAAAELLFDAYLNGRTVFTMGNGASAALAAHMACDLGKGTAMDLGLGPEVSPDRRLRIVSLADNIALLTAYSNDLGYQEVFVEQLKNMLQAGDVVMGISGSGGSPNVLRGLLYARERGAVTIGFTGARSSGDLLAGLCDVCIRAPLTMMEQIEDLHVVFHHAISIALRAQIHEHALAVKWEGTTSMGGIGSISRSVAAGDASTDD